MNVELDGNWVIGLHATPDQMPIWDEVEGLKWHVLPRAPNFESHIKVSEVGTCGRSKKSNINDDFF